MSSKAESLGNVDGWLKLVVAARAFLRAWQGGGNGSSGLNRNQRYDRDNKYRAELNEMK